MNDGAQVRTWDAGPAPRLSAIVPRSASHPPSVPHWVCARSLRSPGRQSASTTAALTRAKSPGLWRGALRTTHPRPLKRWSSTTTVTDLFVRQRVSPQISSPRISQTGRASSTANMTPLRLGSTMASVCPRRHFRAYPLRHRAGNAHGRRTPNLNRPRPLALGRRAGRGRSGRQAAARCAG
jgi:hypothetical protein